MTLTHKTTFPINHQSWQAGLTLDQYIEMMQHKQDAMRHRLREVSLSPSDRDDFKNLKRTIKVVVMTEDWCGDALMNLPILAKIQQTIPDMQMRIFIRSQSPELESYYASQNIFSIPVFTFLDSQFNQIGTWVERPQAAQIWDQRWVAKHPEIETIKASQEFSQDEKRALLKPIYQKKLIEMETWYNHGLQQATIDELKAILCPESCHE